MVDSPARARSGSPQASARTFVLRFLLVFLALEAFVYLVLWRDAWFDPYAAVNARVAAVLMSPILEGAHAAGSYLSTSRFSILVRPGCDAYQASAVLLAGVAAFPARTRHKLIGAAVGTAALMVLNFLRLGALLWTGENHPEQFERMHIQVLPIVFVAAALGLLLSWALWARR